MLTHQLISITDLRQNATHIIKSVENEERIVVVHNRPKAAIIGIHDYEAFKRLSPYGRFINQLTFLTENFSLSADEPDLYVGH